VEESLEQFRRVQSLDPASPKMYAGFGWLLLSARRYDEAIQQLQKSLEMEPGFGLTHLYLGWAYEAKGLPEKAIPELRQATLSHRGTGELASLAHAYAVGGHLPQAQTFLNELKEQSKTRLCPTVRHRRCICRDGQQRSRV
jgi:tetratricopeptide (TPR) repeat protein